VLIIFTYRPEFVHTWGGRSYHNQVTLSRLSNRESLLMVFHLLSTDAVDPELQRLILNKTEGVPFFIEEYVQSLQGLGVIRREDGKILFQGDLQSIAMPSTIQDMIMARVDRLPDGAKAVLRAGSAIEREFTHDLIRAVTGLPEPELLSHLSVLKDAELLYQRGVYPQASYIFRHAVTRDVVYDSILTKRKKILHGKIGKAIEELYKESIDEHYEFLASHYIAGEDYGKGAVYCKWAGRKAEKAASLVDAITYGEKRISCLERLPQTEDVEKSIIDARTTIGLYYIQMNYFFEAKKAVEPVVELALERDYKRRNCQINSILGTHCFVVEEDFPKAFEYLEDALKIAEELNDILSLWNANYWLGAGLAFNANFEKAFYYLEKAMAINVAANALWGVAGLKSTISMFICNFQGKISLGYQTSNEALLLAEESGDIYSKAIAHATHGWSCFCKGFLDEIEGHLLKAINYCEKINLYTFGTMAHSILGDTFFDRGEYRKAQNHYNKAISIAEHRGFMPTYINLQKMALAKSRLMMNEKNFDLQLLYGYVDGNKVRIYEGWMLRYIGEILLNIDAQHMSEANHFIERAIEADRKNDMTFELSRDHVLYADLLSRKGDQTKAKENLSKAIEIFKDCGADGWVEKYEKELAALT